MSDHDISAIQSSIKGHVQAALGTTTFNILDGAPRGYAPPQVNIWWAGAALGPPYEVQEVPYRWVIRITAESGEDPERQDKVAQAWELIFDRYKDSDAISAGGNAQLVYPSAVELLEVETDGMLYVGIDITLTVIVKKARVFV